jgi:hypothetical protein
MSDLTVQEQTHVRTALRFLRARCGGWEPLAKALRFNPRALAQVGGGRVASATMAFRVARFVKVGVDDLLAGRFPAPGTCPHCGHYEPPSTATSQEPALT